MSAVLFLDVDGVLNTMDEHETRVYTSDETLVHITKYDIHAVGYYVAMQYRLLLNLKRVFDAYPTLKIVISSTWRENHEYRSFLLAALVDVCQIDVTTVVLGDTPVLGYLQGGRGAEVRAWLADHPEYSHFVIVDDDHEDSFRRHGLLDHLVQTSLDEGLDDASTDEVLKVLRRQLEE